MRGLRLVARKSFAVVEILNTIRINKQVMLLRYRKLKLESLETLISISVVKSEASKDKSMKLSLYSGPSFGAEGETIRILESSSKSNKILLYQSLK